MTDLQVAPPKAHEERILRDEEGQAQERVLGQKNRLAELHHNFHHDVFVATIARPLVSSSGSYHALMGTEPSSNGGSAPDGAAPDALIEELSEILQAIHGSLEAGFHAMDGNKRGCIDMVDFLEGLRNCNAPFSQQGTARLFDRLDVQRRGAVNLAEFLDAFGAPSQGLVCAHSSFRRGDTAELLYSLDSAEPSGTAYFLHPGSRGAWQSYSRPFVALVPGEVTSYLPRPNAEAAVLIEPLNPNHRSGRVRLVVPEDAVGGYYEWKLFTGFGVGRQVGRGIPCTVENAAPLAVNDLRVVPSVDREDELLADWTPPTDPLQNKLLYYELEVELATNGEFSKVTDGSWQGKRQATEDASQTQIVISPIQGNSDYRVRVRGVNKFGAGKWSNVCTITTKGICPGPPKDLQANASGVSAIRLVWHAPENDGGSPVVGYQVFAQCVSPIGRNRNSRVFSTSTTDRTYLVKGLPANAEHRFWVKAINSTGEGPASEEVTAKSGPCLPGAPGPPQISELYQKKCTLSWTSPEDEGGSCVLYYQIKVIKGIVEAKSESWLVQSRSPTCMHPMCGLDGNSQYRFQVRAVNRLGQGPWSPESAPVRTGPVPPQPPGRPTATAAGHSSAHLRWSAPIDDGGAPILNYLVHAAPRSHPYRTVTVEAPTGMRSLGIDAGEAGYIFVKDFVESFMIEGLQANSSYVFQVQAVNRLGVSDLSEASENSCTDASVPSRPGKPALLENRNRQVVLSWEPPAVDGGSPVTNYEVVALETENSEENIIITKDAQGVSSVPVRANTRYRFTVRANNKVGTSDASPSSDEILTAKTAPTAPQQLRVSDVTISTISLTWDSPVDDGGEKILRYEVLVFATGQRHGKKATAALCGGRAGAARLFHEDDYSDAQLVRVDDTGSIRTSYDVCDLQGNATYFFQVRAVSAIGPGANSGVSDIFATCPQPPDPPAPPVVQEVTQCSADLQWQQPLRDGGTPVIGYVVSVIREIEEESAGDEGEREHRLDTAQNTYTVRGLAADAMYRFKVRALSSAGEGPWSGPSELCQTNPPPPLAPGQPVLIEKDKETVVLACHSPQGTRCQYQCTARVPQVGAVMEVPCEVIGNSPSLKSVKFKVSKLKENTQYQFSLCAQTESGRSDPSPWSIIITTEQDLKVAAEVTQALGSSLLLAAETLTSPHPSTPSHAHPHIPTFPNLHPPGRPSAEQCTSPGEVQLTWAASSPPATAYIVHVFDRSDNNGTAVQHQVSAPPGQSCISVAVTGLLGGREYAFQVQALGESANVNISEESERIALKATPPSPPGCPVVSAVDCPAESLRLSWMAPEANGGENLLGYRVLIFQLNQDRSRRILGPDNILPEGLELDDTLVDSVGVQDVPASMTQKRCETHLVNGLVDDAPYVFQVQAVNALGASVPSGKSLVVWVQATPSLCRNLECQQIGQRAVQLTWRAPERDGAGPVTGYRLTVEQHRQGNSRPEIRQAVLPLEDLSLSEEGSAFRHILEGLEPGAEYRFRVAGVNSIGTGAEDRGMAPSVVLPQPHVQFVEEDAT